MKPAQAVAALAMLLHWRREGFVVPRNTPNACALGHKTTKGIKVVCRATLLVVNSSGLLVPIEYSNNDGD